MLIVKLRDDFLPVNLHVADLYTPEVKPEVRGGHLFAVEFNLDEASIPFTLRQTQINFVTDVGNVFRAHLCCDLFNVNVFLVVCIFCVCSHFTSDFFNNNQLN